MADQMRNARRNEDWYRDHAVRGMTLRAIAERDGVSQATVHAGIQAVRDSIPQSTREQRIADVLEFYAKVRNEAWALADLPGAPVTAGTLGEILHDPETGQPVRDYAGRLRALETAMKTVEHERRLLGLDAAQKIEQTVTDQTAAMRAAKEARKRLEGVEE